ncbi:bifunctional riboflavin kinase/FAD synthetase [Porticoccus sp. W117]|uniref:bifunctional riboflavin kinase/FAD synthetase n=1 Tax=Porticoccus sp. W117 TaxID=3054777 RepID=UPI002598EFFC|nr:bifunctional riboflavin kinase/FAD synthetase [Porticoccus sp. W117]MDM3871267.1 bifunctional riboflavin kinase/FAD synthetase [Porticoccus sp. W117]
MPNSSPLFIRGIHNLPIADDGSVVTIGSFDGIHLGHQAILQQLREESQRLDLPSVAVIFEPQPREFFGGELGGEQVPARLMRLREKVTGLFTQGIDRVCCLQFNARFRSFTAREFIQQILVEGLKVRSLIVGDDFRFGCDRDGDFALLQQVGSEQGFAVQDTCTVSRDNERISSTRVRRELDAANFDEVAALLGKPYSISGRVVRGQQLGRQLGVPTANMHLHRYRAPLSGVFAVEVSVAGLQLQGVANVGVRPTVEESVKPILEVHLFNWSGDIYGQRMTVTFRHKIREEMKFASLQELQGAIANDIEQAKQFFGL